MTRLRILIAAALVGSWTLFGTGGGATAAPTYQCFGQSATIVGTPGDDVLVGSEHTADVIVGLGGNDTILGAEDPYAGSSSGDRLCGGPGDDYIRGAVSPDRIQGGAGNDNVDGSFFYDYITQGGPGNDRVADCDSEYTGGVRTISGGAGDDWVCVDDSVTRMYGDGGNDVLTELVCGTDSLLSGGPGDDQMSSYFDNFQGTNCSDFGGDFLDADRVRGGDGNDSARVNVGDIVTDTESVTRE